MSRFPKKSSKRSRLRLGPLKKVKVKDLVAGPKIYESLGRQLESRIAVIEDLLKEVLPPRKRDNFGAGFLHDMHPDREVMVWESIARTYTAEINARELAGTTLTPANKESLFKALLVYSLSGSTADVLDTHAAAKSVGGLEQVFKCYEQIRAGVIASMAEPFVCVTPGRDLMDDFQDVVEHAVIMEAGRDRPTLFTSFVCGHYMTQDIAKKYANATEVPEKHRIARTLCPGCARGAPVLLPAYRKGMVELLARDGRILCRIVFQIC